MSWRTLLRDELRDLHAPQGRGPDAQVCLDDNESPYPLPPDVAEALGRELASLPLHRYPDAVATEARQACASWLGVGPESVCLGNGTDELITMVVQAFGKPRRGETRARVAYPVPTYGAYRLSAVACGAMPLEMPLKDDFSLDPAALERHVTGGKPNIVFLARPNNPTGTLWDRDVVEHFIERRTDAIVVLDEAYGDYAGESLAEMLPRRENLIVLRSLSALGLAGVRVGVLLGHPDLVAEVQKLRPAFNLGSLAQRAVTFLLGQHQARLREHIDQIIAERERLFAALVEGRRCQAFPSRANFLLLRVPDAEATAAALLGRGVRVRDVSRAGLLRGCLRVTIGSPQENTAFLHAFNDVAAPVVAATPEPAAGPRQGEEEEPEEAEGEP